MKIVLYYAPIACSLVPYVTLTEAGADFEVRAINIRRKQQMSAEYLQINPKHKVPVLVIDGKPLTENVAIQTWIARNFPDAKLFPADPWGELEAVSLHGWCSSGIHPYLSRLNSPQKCCDLPDAEDSVRRLAQSELRDVFAIADARLAGRDFFFDHFTTVDAHFFWCFRRAMALDVDLSQPQFGNCMRHFEQMMERPSVRKLLDFEKCVQAQFAAAA